MKRHYTSKNVNDKKTITGMSKCFTCITLESEDSEDYEIE